MANKHERSTRQQPSDEGADPLARALATLDQRNAQPYDGVLGQPPEWMPWPLRDEFFTMRDRLLDCGHSDAEIRRWMRAYVVDSGKYPIKHARELEGLVYVRDIALLGEHDGLAVYLGKAKKGVRRVYSGPARSESDVIDGHENEKRRSAAQRKADNERAGNWPRDAAIFKEAHRLRQLKKHVRNIPSLIEGRIQRGELKLDDGSVIAPLTSRQIKRILDG